MIINIVSLVIEINESLPSGKNRRKSSLCIVYFWQHCTVFWVSNKQKRTPSDCFFGDFAHLVISVNQMDIFIIRFYYAWH